MISETLKEKKYELILAIVLGVGGFLAGQSFQALENKAVMDSKNYVQTEIGRLRKEMELNISSLKDNTSSELKYFEDKIFGRLLQSAKTITSAEEVLEESGEIIGNARDALSIIKEKEKALEKLLSTNAGVTSASVAEVLRPDLDLELKKQTEQLISDLANLRQQYLSTKSSIENMSEDMRTLFAHSKNSVKVNEPLFIKSDYGRTPGDINSCLVVGWNPGYGEMSSFTAQCEPGLKKIYISR